MKGISTAFAINRQPQLTIRAISFTLMVILLLILPRTALSVEVTLLFWGDRHAHNLPETRLIHDEYVSVGGAAELAGAVNLLRANVPRCLVLVAGDEFTGTPASSRTAGLSEIKLLNEIGIDAFVPGNHEFDFGWRSLLKVTSKANFPTLLSNVSMEDDTTRLFPADTTFNLDGVKVGVVGVIYQDFTEAVVREGILGLSVEDPIATVSEFISRRRSSCDLLIALSHMGVQRDSLLAASVDGLDIIIGGHSHTEIDPPLVVNDVIIVQAGSDGRILGRLVVDVDTNTDDVRRFRGELLTVRPELAPPDKGVAKLVKKLEKKYTKDLNRKIATLQTDWRLDRYAPSNLAQWSTDAMLHQVRSLVSDRINLSVINAGNLRKEMGRGAVTERDLWEICPFENPVLIFQISGVELVNIIKFQLKTPREYLTWSGMDVIVEDNKIKSIQINGLPLDKDMDYSVVATGYLWEHLDSYFGLQHNERPMFYVPDVTQRGLLIKMATQQRVISSPLDDRWDVR